MSDWIAKDSAGDTYDLDHLCTQKWLDGQTQGVEIAVAWLLTEATTRFGKRETKEALALQTLADKMRDDLMPETNRRADEHRNEYPAKIEEQAT